MHEKRLPPPRRRNRTGLAAEAPFRESPVSGGPVVRNAGGSFLGAYLLGSVLVALLALRLTFGP